MCIKAENYWYFLGYVENVWYFLGYPKKVWLFYGSKVKPILQHPCPSDATSAPPTPGCQLQIGSEGHALLGYQNSS